MKERPIYRAVKDVLGSDATIADLPPNRPILAGDIKAIKKAGQQARKIAALTEAYSEGQWIKRAIKVSLAKIRKY